MKRNTTSFLPTSYKLQATSCHSARGVTLLDTVVGVALMLVVFVGIASAFQLSVRVVTNNKARAGAIALGDQRMEFIRSLAYSAVGTVGGIPSGAIPQTEALTFNGVYYTRRTYIEYDDDPADGTGASDANHITEDYKAVKVQVLWNDRNTPYAITLVTRVSPATGLETNVPGGTLSILSVNSLGTPVPGASVAIVATSASPTVNINTFTDASGTATILGAPTYSGYQVIVTSPGYSTAQTYNVTAQNTSPNPGNLSVANARTTSATFAIDVLGNKTVNTWTQVLTSTSSDPFNNTSLIATSTGIVITGGTAMLATGSTTGEVQSVPFGPSSLANWGTFSWSDTQPATTSIRYRVYTGDGTTLIPDSLVPGNAAGFVSGSVNLSNVSTSTYPTIRLDAVFSTKNASTTPSLSLWSVNDTYGPLPLGNIAFNLQGAKTIGSGPSGTIYKFNQNFSTNASGTVAISNLEWDNYTVSISGATTGYDIASACNPQPESLSPGATMTSNFYLTAHTTNSLLVNVRSAATGSLIPGASVTLTKTGYSSTLTADACGQAFFPSLSAATYSISVSAAGHTTYTSNAVSVSGTSFLSVALN